MRTTTQIYLIDHDRWLMMYRNRKKNDINAGKWIGIGGKQEKDETVAECALRETFEETGLRIDKLDFRGIVYFAYEDHESETIYVYSSEQFHGTMHETGEGTLAWIKQDEILDLDLWEGDRVFLQSMMNSPDKFIIELSYDTKGGLKSVRHLDAEIETGKNQ